ncbi:MAG: porphobilinogen synthase [Lentisphaerota bacterium]
MNEINKVKLSRIRRTAGMREMFGMQIPAPSKFIWPVFVVEGQGIKEPIGSMPNQFRYSPDMLIEDLEKVVEMGIGGIMIFGVMNDHARKSSFPDYPYREDGAVQKAIHLVKMNFPDLLVCTDVCLCAYTNHGHCCLFDDCGKMDIDKTNALLAKIALSHAQTGADCVAPSAMMDGQVCAIRNILDENHFQDTLIMSYSTKFASSMYGPFRSASECTPQFGDRRSYQLPANDIHQAIRESLQDEKEGADILMVKPALFYLDIISAIRKDTKCPLAAYNVSGEYSMLHASAKEGYGDLYPMASESLLSIFRAGADVVLSYWANQYDRLFKK